MDTPTPSPREQAVAAMQAGDLDAAVGLLTKAVLADDNDADARALLGMAYSQRGLHAEAVRALQSAVTLQPQNPHYLFNYAVAMERAGDAAGAIPVYQAVLRADPQNAQARQRLQALGGSVPVVTPPAGAVPAGVAPAPTPAGAPPSAPAYGAPSAAKPPPPGMPPAATPPPGTVVCPRCGQQTRPGYSCSWCNTPLPTVAKAPPPGMPAPAPLDGGYKPAYTPTPNMGNGEAFLRRFAAIFIDGFLVQAASFAVGMVFGIGGAVTGMDSLAEGGASLTGLMIGLVYYVGLQAWRGQTLGKIALGIRVIAADGNPPTWGWLLLRETIGRFVSGILCSIGYFAVLWDGEQQGWHDKIARTWVIRT